jgi:hypothetical protein
MSFDRQILRADESNNSMSLAIWQRELRRDNITIHVDGRWICFRCLDPFSCYNELLLGVDLNHGQMLAEVREFLREAKATRSAVQDVVDLVSFSPRLRVCAA